MKTKRNKRTIGIIVIIVIIAFAIFAVVKAKRKEAKLPIAKQYGIVVSTFHPKINEVTLTLPYLSQTENDKDVKLSSKVSARVNYIKASGSKVKRGEIIAKLDNTSIKSNEANIHSQLKAQEIALENLEDTHKRTKELLDVGGASIEQYEKEDSNIEGLKAKIESLHQNQIEVANTLTYATIESPVDGVISKTMVNKGDMCMPGHPIANISASNGFYLLLRIPTNLTIYGVKYRGEDYPAVSLNSTFNNLSEYKVYVNNSTGLITGDRLEVDVIVFKGTGIKLPFDAILNRDGKSYVLIKENDKAVPFQITVLQTGEDGAVISNQELAGKEIAVAKQDILLKLLSGENLITKNN